MPDDAFRQAKTLTAAGVAAAGIVAILFFTPILDNMGFCFPHTCTPATATQDGRPDKGGGCEPCGPVCTGGHKDEEKKKPDGGGSVTTTTENHSIDDHSVTNHSVTIENISIYGSAGRTARKGEDWCPLPPDEEEEGECAAGSSGTKELLGRVYFENDSADPLGKSADHTEERVKILDGIVERIRCRLREQPGETILLEAYASYPGSAAYNLNLAGERIQNLAHYIGAHVEKSMWEFQQVIYGESHIYRSPEETVSTGETSGQKGDPRNRVVRIFAYSDPCGDVGREAVLNPNP